MTIQAVVFDKAQFSVGAAQTWLTRHGFAEQEPVITEHTLRFKQSKPGAHRYKTLQIAPGIQFVIEY